MSDKTFKILILKNRGLGDAIMGLSSLQFLRNNHPQAKIFYGVPAWVYPLFNNVSSVADGIIPLRMKSLSDFWKFFKEIKEIKPDLIHELHAGGRTHLFTSIVAKLLGIKHTYHDHDLFIEESKKTVFDQGVLKPLIQRDLDGVWSCLKLANLNKTDQPENYLSFEPKLELRSEPKNQLIFGMVATRETKMWPIEHFAKLSQLIFNNDPDCKILIPLSPSEMDQEIEKRILSSNFAPNFEIIKARLEKLPLTMAGSKMYVGNDTGLKHICISLGIKTHTLFGPEPPFEWHPYDQGKHSFDYIEPLECRTRTHHYCGLATCESMICLNQITAEKVYDYLKTYLKNEGK